MPIHFLSRQEHSHCQCNTYCYYLFIIGIVTIYMLLCCFLYYVSQSIFFREMNEWVKNECHPVISPVFLVFCIHVSFFRESHRVTHYNSWQEHVIVLFGTFDWLLVPVTWALLQKKSDKKCTIISKMCTSFVET